MERCEINYLLKIRLFNIEPEIWRRFVVPSSISLDRLHDVIQIVMGWLDSHPYEFNINNKLYTESPMEEQHGAEVEEYRICDLIKKNGSSFQYSYDFGDNWKHEIVLENNRYFNPEHVKIPAIWGGYSPVECLAGARTCPPEDVGGTDGYKDFCAALKSSAHRKHKEYKEWFGNSICYNGKFDSEYFNLEQINLELRKYLRWSRDRYQKWGNIQ